MSKIQVKFQIRWERVFYTPCIIYINFYPCPKHQISIEIAVKKFTILSNHFSLFSYEKLSENLEQIKKNFSENFQHNKARIPKHQCHSIKMRKRKVSSINLIGRSSKFLFLFQPKSDLCPKAQEKMPNNQSIIIKYL